MTQSVHINWMPSTNQSNASVHISRMPQYTSVRCPSKDQSDAQYTSVGCPVHISRMTQSVHITWMPITHQSDAIFSQATGSVVARTRQCGVRLHSKYGNFSQRGHRQRFPMRFRVSRSHTTHTCSSSTNQRGRECFPTCHQTSSTHTNALRTEGLLRRVSDEQCAWKVF